MTKQRQIIQNLQKQYYFDKNRPQLFLGFKNAIETLSEDLYNKQFHFLYEVIQNADDNLYSEEIPVLKLSVELVNLEGKTNYALCIINNEDGFSEDDLKAICSIGNSTKNKSFDSIGEKGIGFKSVYRITDCPYIYSGHFAFKIPKYNPENENGLGYIVPYEIVGHDYENSYTQGTKIILPLNADVSTEQVGSQLISLKPETILFLRKIKLLEICVDLDQSKLFKRVVRKDSGKFRELSVVENDKEFTLNYFLSQRSIDRPSNIKHDKRQGVDSRVVEVAIPLKGTNSIQGILFSYLPVWQNTGLPFMINADFLLTSNREGLHEDYQWNQWLRDEIAETYSTGFLSLMNHQDVEYKEKVAAYCSIPVAANNSFLESVIGDILDKLKEGRCILCYRTSELCLPSEVRIPNKNLLELLDNSEILPPAIIDGEHPLLSPALLDPRFKEILKVLGVRSLGISELKDWFLMSSEWMESNNVDWLISLYEFLRSETIKTAKINDLPIIKLEGLSGLYSSSMTQIYFNISDSTFNESLPDVVRSLLAFSEVDQNFLSKYLSKEEKEKKVWLENKLGVSEFNLSNLGNQILKVLNASYHELSPEEIVQLTETIYQLDKAILQNHKIILLLNDDRILSIENDGLEVVVPETYNESSGWQHIYLPNNRSHFKVLSSKYPKEVIDCILSKGKVLKLYPSFQQRKIDLWSTPITESGKNLIAHLKRHSANDWYSKLEGYEVLLPLSFAKDKINKHLSHALISYLNSFEIKPKYKWSDDIGVDILLEVGLNIKGVYHYRGRNVVSDKSAIYTFLTESPWLYTSNKGFQVPSAVFIDKPEIKEILGDSVPYISSIKNPSLIKLLGIKSALTQKSLLEYLDDARKGTSDVKILTKIYEQLDQRINKDNPIEREILSKPIIYNPATSNWVSALECIWEDLELMDADTGFIALSKYYPESLSRFFIDKLNVSRSLSAESFIEKWKVLQESDKTVNPDIVSMIYRKLKQHVIRRDNKRVNQFVKTAKLYSLSYKRFVDVEDLYFADDIKLKKAFQGQVDFAYVPDNDAYAAWIDFFKSFGLPQLSENVGYKLGTSITASKRSENVFLTTCAIKLIAAYIKTKNEDGYRTLLDTGFFKKIIVSEEYICDSRIPLSLYLERENIAIEEDDDIFFDFSSHALYYFRGIEKSDVAKALVDHIRKSIKLPRESVDSFELYLGENTLKRKSKAGFQTPEEVYELFEQLKDQKISHQAVKVNPANIVEQPIEESSDIDNERLGNLKKDPPTETSRSVISLEKLDGRPQNVPSKPKGESALGKNEGRARTNKEKEKEPSDSGELKTSNDFIYRPQKLNANAPNGYQSPSINSRRSAENTPNEEPSTLDQVLKKQRKNQIEVSRFNDTESRLNREEELLKALESCPKFSFLWLQKLTELEYLQDIDNLSANTYNITFNRVGLENGIVHLDFPNQLFSSRIEEYENLKLVLFLNSKTITISVQSVSVDKYSLRAKLWMASDISILKNEQIEKAVLKVESVDFLWQTLLDQLYDVQSNQSINAKVHLSELIRDYNISFIFGPPGTGKTTKIVEEHLIPAITHSNQKTLVLAPTNKAADVITERLMRLSHQGNYFRFGNTGKQEIEDHKCFIAKSLNKKFSSYTLITTIARFPYDMISFGSGEEHLRIRQETWDKVIVDEASMVNLSQIIGMIMSLPKSTEFIIVGDPFQIQPILNIKEWANSNIYDVVELTSFQQNTTEKNAYKVERLMMQYRSLLHIGGLYSEYCYEGKLQSSRGNLGKPEFVIFGNYPLKSLSIITFPVDRDSSLYSPKYLNKSSYHIYLGLLLVEWLVTFVNQFPEGGKTIGIISPYRAQSDLLYKLVNANYHLMNGCAIDVSTIHSFQGDECDIIICAFNPPLSKNRTVALNDKNVINVAISRAKDHLIMFMPSDYNNYSELRKIRDLVERRSHFKADIKDVEFELFGSKKYIENITYTTAHHPINVFGRSDYKYEIRVEDDAIDIQINNNEPIIQ